MVEKYYCNSKRKIYLKKKNGMIICEEDFLPEDFKGKFFIMKLGHKIIVLRHGEYTVSVFQVSKLIVILRHYSIPISVVLVFEISFC